MTFNPAVFREYDIRGIAGRDLDETFCQSLGRAFSSYLKEKNKKEILRVVVGRDCRLTSDSYADALIRGIRASGVDVIALEVCPTPLTYFATYHLEVDGAVMITGSHNSSDYNGFKICAGKETLFGEAIQELRKMMETQSQSPPTSSYEGDLSHYEIIPPYTAYLTERFQNLKPQKIVIDAGNGTAGNVAPELFKQLGAEVISLYCDLDGRFPNHHPDPTVPAHLKDLIEKVLEEKADFGLAFDGDADRLGVVDDQGRILFGDELMVLFSRSILKELPGATIISEVKSSHRLYQDITAKGGKALMWKTGHSLIKSKMKETKAALAGEMSGHLFFADRYFGFDDALYAGARLYEIASRSHERFSELLSDLPQTVSTPEIRVDCEESKKFALVNETKKRIQETLSSQAKLIDIDGIRVDFGDGWGLVRASNTQPVLVLRFEAETSLRLKEIRAIIESLLQNAAQAIDHPPLICL